MGEEQSRHDPQQSGQSGAAERAACLSRVGAWLDRLLIADVFLVIGGGLWFIAAVVLRGQGLEAPLDLFQQLWDPLFTPAIGLLMAAALTSGALGWIRRRLDRNN